MLSSCDLLGRDQFPTYLNYEIAKVDLGSLIASEGLKTPYYVTPNDDRRRETGGTRRALIYVNAYEGSRAVRVRPGRAEAREDGEGQRPPFLFWR